MVSNTTASTPATIAPPPALRWWSPTPDLVVLVLASALMALPFAALHHVNTIDGPGHVLGARLLGGLGNTTLVHHYYQSSFTVAPNLLTEVLLGVLMAVVSPTWSEKLVTIAYIVSFPLAVRFAIRSVNPAAGWLALLALPFTVNYLFLFGFYDFCYGMVGAFVAIGLAVRWRRGWTWRRVLALASVLLLTFAAHVVPWVMGALIIVTLALVDAMTEYHRTRPTGSSGDGDGAVGIVRRLLLPPVLSIVPALALAVTFMLSGSTGGLAMQRKSLKTLIEGLVTLTLPTVSYSRLEIAAALITAAALVFLLVVSARGLRASGMTPLTIGLGVCVLVCVVVYFVSPDYIGTGSYLNDRISLFAPLMLVLACASVPTSARVWRAAGIVGLIAALAVAGARLPTQVHYDRLVSEYLSIERVITPGATIVALRFSVYSPPLGSARYKQADPLAHEASRVAADKGDVDLRHFEGQLPYFPHRFRPELEALADAYLNDFYVPPDIDLRRYNASAGPVQYVLVVGLADAPPHVRDAPGTRALEEVLATQYVRVVTTRPTGLVEVYRHR